MSRRSIDIPTFVHKNPIPAATRIGPLLASSVIPPFDANSRVVPDGIDAQIANLFERIGEILEAGGASWGDVAKITFFVADITHRESINEPWAARFPDPDSRPARHTQIAELGGPMLVTCDFIAYVVSAP